MKKIEQSGPSSFHFTTILTTPQSLIDLANKLEADYYDGNTGEDKTNFDFEFETDSGIYFTVYDWKEYRSIDLSETVEFHIGGKSRSDTEAAKEELLYELNTTTVR